MYGTAREGGTSGNGIAGSGFGVVWELSNGALTVLYNFTGGADGAFPETGVTLDAATGSLYGTTTYGGNAGGVVFELSAGTETVLYTLGSDCAPPGLALYSGSFYGSTCTGDVFQLTDGTVTVLHAFARASTGPLVFDSVGDLYTVVTHRNNASLYERTTKGKWKHLYTFRYKSRAASLALDTAGDVYGTTIGVTYQLTPTKEYSVVGTTIGPLMLNAGELFGVGSIGGQCYYGCVLELAPPL
jgi:hypothetical protein